MKHICPIKPIIAATLFIMLSGGGLFCAPQPLSKNSLQQLSVLEKDFPSLTAQTRHLANGNFLQIDYDKAIALLSRYLENAGTDVRQAVTLVLQPELYRAEQRITSREITLDGRSGDWEDIGHRVTDDTGDSFGKRADMDIVSADAFFSADKTLYAMIACRKPPAVNERIDLLLDLSGDDSHDVQFVIYGWTDGKIYTSLYDLRTRKNLSSACSYAVFDVLEIMIPFSEIRPEKEVITVLARCYDKDASVIDNAPVIRLRQECNNYALLLLFSLLANNCWQKDDPVTCAIALVNSCIFELGDSQVRNRIAGDVKNHYKLYTDIIAWQDAEKLPWKLKYAPIVPKMLWADRSGGVLSEIRDSMKTMNTNGKLTLPVYNEFVDSIVTLESVSRIIRAKQLCTRSLSSSSARLEDFVHTNRVYRSSIENLEDFNKRRIFSDEDLKKAREEIKKGEYTIDYFCKKRRWDEFRWLNYQYGLYEKKGFFRGDCGDTTVVQMGFFRAAGIAPVSFQWIHPEGIAAYTHNFPGHYHPKLKRWYSVQKPFFYAAGGTIIENIDVNFHFTKPAWHHWLYSSDMAIKQTGKKSEIYAPYYQGEPVNSGRLVNFLTIGMSGGHFEKVFFSGATMEKGFFFTEQTAPLKIIDTDGDMIPDSIEKEFLTDPRSPDTDSDGFSDVWEIENDYDPVSAASAADRTLVAIDGIARPVGEREGLLSIQDVQYDSLALNNGLDIKSMGAKISGDNIYILADFYQPAYLSRDAFSHAFLISLKNREEEAYWVQWYNTYFSVYDARKSDSTRWTKIDINAGFEFRSLNEAEFLIPVSLFKSGEAVYIQYFSGGYTDDKKTFNTGCDYTDQLRLPLAPDPLLALVEESIGNSSLVSDEEGDVRDVKNPKDLKSLNVMYIDGRLICLPEFYHPGNAPFGIHSFSIQSKNRDLNYWIQWVSINDVRVYTRPFNGTSKEDTTIVRDNFACIPYRDGYAFFLPENFFVLPDVLSVRYFEGGYDAKNTFVYDADQSGIIRTVLGDALITELLFRKPNDSARVVDPKNDYRAKKDFFDIREFTASSFPEGILCSAEYHHPVADRVFGLHTIYIRDPVSTENWWIQWWNYSEFSYSYWKDNDSPKVQEKARTQFDIMSMETVMYFYIPADIFAPGSKTRSFEVTCYAAGYDAEGTCLYDSDMTTTLKLSLPGEGGHR